jgi:hypothetical protein
MVPGGVHRDRAVVQPLGGIVTDYFVRIEFQERGSLHAHMVVWVAGFPSPQTHPVEYVAAVDAVVQTEVPRPADTPDGHSFFSPALLEIVLRCQRHLFSHTGACRVVNGAEEKRNAKKDSIRENAAKKRAQEREAAVL